MLCSPIASAATLGGVADSAVTEQVDGSSLVDSEKNEIFEPDITGSGETKLSPGVQSTLSEADSDRVPVIVVFRRQPENELPLNSLSAAEVSHEMRTLAAETQGPFLRYLTDQKQQGKAAHIKSLYLRNAIAVEADKEVVRELASSSLVDRVIYDSKVSALSDDGTQSEIEAFYGQFADTDNVSIAPSGFERVSTGERARGVEEIGADSVHRSGIIGEGVNVSVIDTGINDSHPALKGQVVKRKDFVDSDSNTTLINESGTDPHGHGTHVAGTIAGKRSAQQAVGVAPGADLFDARVLDAYGSGTISDIISAFEWSADNHADVASASLGLDPAADSQTTRLTIANRAENATSVRVYDNADQLYENQNLSENHSVADTFKPGSVFVAVDDVTALENTTLDAGETTQNLTLDVESPSGNQTLEQYDASFLNPLGGIPDDVLVYKYKPSNPQVLESGNWSVSVNNTNEIDVAADVSTLTMYPPDGTDDISQAVNNLESTGTIPVIASGNAGLLGKQTVGSPAVAENAITVGASQPNSIDVAPFSSRGPVGFGTDARPGVDLIAPGVDIVSAGSPEAFPGDEPYVSFSGTSMATPHVSGTIALMMSADSSLDRSTIETTLESTAQSPPLPESTVGGGALDAFAAVDNVTAETLTADQNAEGVEELYAGIGDTASDNVYVDLEPDTDPVGDAGTAPDFEKALVDVDEDDAEFQIRLADETAPNATFVTYIDADQNDTTGDKSQYGAEYRLNLTRTLTDGSYEGIISVYEFNASNGQYELASDIGARDEDWAYDDHPEYVQYEIDTNEYDGINTTEFDWHVVSQDPDSTSTDRLPDTGQVDAAYDVSVPGIGVAWNATAGAPVADHPIDFQLSEGYDETTIANETVRTNSAGVAKTAFNVSASGYQDFEVEISDDRGNSVTQSYDTSAYIDSGPELSESTVGDNTTVVERDYEVQFNETTELNFPVYTTDTGEITPYSGEASIKLDEGDDPATLNNLTVEDGVLTTNFTPSETDAFLDDEFADIQIALTSTYSEATTVYDGGFIDVNRGLTYQTSLRPITQVTQPQTAANLSFQTTETRYNTGGSYEQTSPSNVSSQYEVLWVTDRITASVYNELPGDVAANLDEAQQTEGQSTLSRSDREVIEEAIRNVSTQGISITTSEGNVTPERHGIGQFDVTPPEDARFGLALIAPNELDSQSEFTSVQGSIGLVFVDQRIEQYRRTPTDPETAEYSLDIYGYWDSYTTDDYRLPNETIDVRVELRNQETDEPVPNTSVQLYTTGGDSKTVTTTSDGVAETTISAPDIDYRNRSYEFERQQILGIARGLQTDDGAAVSDIDRVYGSVYEIDDTSDSSESESNYPYPDSELSYDEANETLGLEVVYRNRSTWEPTNATPSQVVIGSPNADYSTQQDVFVGYVGENTDDTTVSREFSEPIPDGQSRSYEVRTRTASSEYYGGWDSLYLNGISTHLSAPAQIGAGGSGEVSVELTSRTGEPVSNATVLLQYVELTDETTSLEEEMPSAIAGDSLTATTDADGVATFTISPEVTSSDTEYIGLEASYATETVAERQAETETIEVTNETTISGSVETADGTAPAGDYVVGQSGTGEDALRSDTEITDNGAFTLQVANGNAYDVAFAQNGTPTDSVPDLYTFASTGSVDSDTDLGPTTLPTGNTVDFQVIDESSNPVSDAEVTVTSHGEQAFDSQGVSVSRETDSQGYISGTDGSIDLADNVTVEVTPPESDSYVDRSYTQQLTVTSDGSVTVTLDEINDTTAPTVRVNAPSEAIVNETITVDASDSTDNIGIANYTFVGPNTSTTQTDPTTTFVFNETGTKNITVTATDAVGNHNSTTVSVDVLEQEPDDIPTAIDANNNGQIDDVEVLTAIEYWRTGDAVPDTNGETIGDFELLTLIEQWRNETPV